MWFIPNVVTVRDSCLLEGFRDCHCHLLPGVDDGVQQLGETLQILREWETVGVSEVWLTPHIMEDVPNEPAELKRQFAALLDTYEGGIRLHLAAEHMMDGLFMRRFAAGNLLPYDTESMRLLVETSYYIPPMNMDTIIDNIKAKGFQPLLAHPERYQYMEKDDYRHWKEKGVLLQLNLPSLVGAYGHDVQRKAEWLLKENMYDCFGSDTHSMEQVDFFLNAPISRNMVKKVRSNFRA